METHKGIGTRLIGRKDDRPDGSYVSTKWFVIFLMPVRYLGTFRVKLNKGKGFFDNSFYDMQRLDDDQEFIRSIKLKHWGAYAAIFVMMALGEHPDLGQLFDIRMALFLVKTILACVVVTVILLFADRK
jgi:hypothetical protein